MTKSKGYELTRTPIICLPVPLGEDLEELGMQLSLSRKAGWEQLFLILSSFLTILLYF